MIAGTRYRIMLHPKEPLNLKYRLAGTRVQAKFDAFVRAFERRYDPNHPQPRDDRGRWTDTGGEQSGGNEEFRDVILASRRRQSGLEAICKAQYDRDIFHCSMVGIRACYEQAMVRRIACEKGHPIPPLNY